MSQNTTYFSTLVLKYAYSQLNLDLDTANYCNFKIISGDMNGTYRFYGLTDMPAEFQKSHGLHLNWFKDYIRFSR